MEKALPTDVVFEPNTVVYSSTEASGGLTPEDLSILAHSQVLDVLGEGVLITDDQATIRFANAAFNRMSGYQPGELLGRPAAVFETSSEGERRAAQIVAHLQAGE